MLFGYMSYLLPISPSNIISSETSNAVVASATTDALLPVPTICGDIIGFANEDLNNNFVFDAYSVYQCFTSVPFLDAVGTRFIEYFNITIQFHSTLGYLKDPPSGYQQPAIDVVAVLEEIQYNITTGQYKNQYDFEATVQALVYAMHDTHVNLAAGILSSFTFGSPFDIMSLSPDGKQAPQVYLKDDIVDSQAQGWTPSHVVSINDEDVTQYLQKFAAMNSVGMLEPHADWNQLMFNPVQDILGSYNVFGWQTTFYPGDDLTFTFANGSTVEAYWLAFYQNFEQTGPLTTGGDFYNYFVLGFLPASFQASADSDTETTDFDGANDDGIPDIVNQTSWHNDSSAYPDNPDIVQPGLSVGGNGFLTGYFYTDISIGVLSVPSFDEFGDSIGHFSNTTSGFIQAAKSAGLTRIVIDLQQNTGGASFLAIDMFKHFFPSMEPYAASRRRSHQLANVLGGATSGFWASLTPNNTDNASSNDETESDYDYYYESLAADEWVITDRLNAATGQNFTSWSEYYGPVENNNDTFSLVERYNLTSTIFDAAAFDDWLPTGYDDGAIPADTPWDPENIVLLTNGICGSTCALFVEMMSHQAGVRTIVVGGAPQTGPMQAVSGSRGASAYTADVLDNDFAFASSINDTAAALLPQVRDPGMYTFTMGFNLRDQVRENDPIPLQFQYEAAHCRIYYTLTNAMNMTRLWRDAAAAIWDDPSLCVEDSTGYATTGNSTDVKPPPSPSAGAVQSSSQVQSAIEAQHPENFNDTLLEDVTDRKPSGSFGPCGKTCTSGKSITRQCPSGGKSICVCLPPCNVPGSGCANNQGNCIADAQTFESKAHTPDGKTTSYSHDNFHHGHCVPKENYSVGCKKPPPVVRFR